MGDYYVSDSASVGRGCRFGRNVVVEDGARLGDGVELGHGAVVLGGVSLGDGVVVGPCAVLGKQPLSGASSVRAAGTGGPLVIGAGSVVGASAVLHAGTVFEENCYLGDLAAVREACRFGRGALVGRLAAVEEECSIGAGSRLMTGAYVTGGTIIEEDVFFGPYAVTTNDRYMSMWKNKTYEGPVLKRGAAVGAGARLLAGVTVGERAVVGMGAVVITDVPAGRIFVGVPARDAGEARGLNDAG